MFLKDSQLQTIIKYSFSKIFEYSSRMETTLWKLHWVVFVQNVNDTKAINNEHYDLGDAKELGF